MNLGVKEGRANMENYYTYKHTYSSHTSLQEDWIWHLSNLYIPEHLTFKPQSKWTACATSCAIFSYECITSDNWSRGLWCLWIRSISAECTRKIGWEHGRDLRVVQRDEPGHGRAGCVVTVLQFHPRSRCQLCTEFTMLTTTAANGGLWYSKIWAWSENLSTAQQLHDHFIRHPKSARTGTIDMLSQFGFELLWGTSCHRKWWWHLS